MGKRFLTGTFIALAILSMAAGYGFNTYIREHILQKPPQNVAKIEIKRQIVREDTRIIYEKEYSRCGHVVIGGFNYRDKIMGLDSEGLKEYFPTEDGFVVSFADNILIIHQNINDYCPNDQQQYKLKEHGGYVAVYTGADENEILLRVTAVKLKLLPEAIQQDIRNGKYTFQDEETLNDTLENLDEYI